jgi:putative beta-lysine N-acetyltransferase
MKIPDSVEVIGSGSVIQHGKHNDRIYLMKLFPEDISLIFDALTDLTGKFAYSKIFCKVPKKLSPLFLAKGYILEAYIPRFFELKEDVLFLSKFLSSDRLLNVQKTQLSDFSTLLQNGYAKKRNSRIKNETYDIKRLGHSDVSKITALYDKVFQTYPFPIYDPDYIHKTMKEQVHYYGAERDEELAAIASSEIDMEARNAEMTDFATHSSHLGNNLSVLLLEKMEKEMKKQGIGTLYTIARLNSLAMNKTFLRSEYQYSGTLINNTNIAGNIESMNVYYKHV